MLTYQQFAILVKKLREAQKLHDSTINRERAQKLAKQVDDEIRKMNLPGANEKQSEMFN